MATARLLPQEEGVAPAQARPPKRSRAPRRSQSTASEARPLPGGKAGLSAELASPGVPLRVARGSGAAAASAGLVPSSCLRVGLPRLSLAAPSSAMSKPPPKPVKPGKSSARCGYGSPGCGTRCRSSRGAPSDSVCTAHQDVLAVWWQHLGRGHFLIFRRVAVKLGVLDRQANGKCATAGWGLRPPAAGLGLERDGDRRFPESFGERHWHCQPDSWAATLSASSFRKYRSVLHASVLLRVTRAN